MPANPYEPIPKLYAEHSLLDKIDKAEREISTLKYVLKTNCLALNEKDKKMTELTKWKEILRELKDHLAAIEED